ncbi:DUF485 domain-containing protein [Neobacillus notoginsengisoli]|uniref:DUF485 domain-containing protein n=1 Tax=Neobacillus notoginsengisoli TaxID=1578198 RepID=A0A417YVX8_9BACI|nr:DUF485 domain-containing protein [Neobacillus notoginsengisoli]RHW41515.1 DUF485 domain-containing protein [Neobacillus notoginsengisoli]
MALTGSQLKKKDHPPPPLDYSKIVQSPSFQQLLREKRKFLLPSTLFFMAFYFTLPILTAYSTVLNNPAFGPISWAWVFAFAQFIMTWALCIIYTKKAARFDRLVEGIIQNEARRTQR